MKSRTILSASMLSVSASVLSVATGMVGCERSSVEPSGSALAVVAERGRPSRTSGPQADDFYGVMFSYPENVTNADPRLQELGVRQARLWMNIKDWNTPENNTGGAKYDAQYDAALRQALELHQRGYKVIFHMNSERGVVPSYDQARGVFAWLLAKPGLREAVDVWEIFNELNNKQYYNLAYSTTVSMREQADAYVQGPLRAAWDVFHVGAGEPVLGGSWTLFQQSADYSPTGAATLALTRAYVDAGYLEYVDYAGIHPYENTTEASKRFMAEALELFGSKPVMITEWGLKPARFGGRRITNIAGYTAAMSEMRSFLHGRVCTAAYYRFTPGNGWPGLVGFGPSYTPVQPAYDTYASWPRNRLANSGFEAGSLEGWTRQGIAEVGAGAHCGRQAARISAGGIEQHVTGLEPNTTYRLSGWARASGGDLRLGARAYNEEEGPNVSQVVSSPEYSYTSLTFTTGPESRSARIYALTSGNGAAELDDVLLVPEQ